MVKDDIVLIASIEIFEIDDTLLKEVSTKMSLSCFGCFRNCERMSKQVLYIWMHDYIRITHKIVYKFEKASKGQPYKSGLFQHTPQNAKSFPDELDLSITGYVQIQWFLHHDHGHKET